MKRYMAVYIGTEDARKRADWDQLPDAKRQALIESGMRAWSEWGAKNAAVIVDQGGPLGKTKRVSSKGIVDGKNSMTGYVIVEAESHDAAARLFERHPHFAIFPGDAVEIMECLPLPRG